MRKNLNKNTIETTKESGVFPLLDSSLITPTFYNIKVVEVGEYIQIYKFQNKKVIRNNDTEDLDLTKKVKINEILNSLDNSKESQKDAELKPIIETRNITRSKLECQRLAKANIKYWETFITLTFAENITDVKSANKRFQYFVDKVRRVKKDFKYLCITEFQKRGAIHYHILTNISANDTKLLFSQEDNVDFKHIKYWNEGFTSVENIKGDPKKIIGYIAKYMTKDIDNRLFSHRRYFYSLNLIRPSTSYLDLETEQGQVYYKKIIQDKSLVYHNKYLSSFDNTEVTFLEFLK